MSPAYAARLAVRLRWALLRGSLRTGGSSAKTVALVLSTVFGVLLALVVLAGLASLRGTPQADDAAVLLFTGLLAGWVALPIITFSSDDLLDARKLATYPLTHRDVLLLHGVGAFLGVAPLTSLIVCLSLVAATGTTAAATVVALLAAALQLVLCVVVSRTAASVLSGVLRSRRGRDLGVALTAVFAVGAQLINPLAQRAAAGSDGTVVSRAADLLRLLPPGLLAAAPRHARNGELGRALLSLLVVVAFVAAVVVAWARSLRRAETATDRSTAPASRSRSLTPARLARLLPRGRAGAVAAKDLRYLTREPRRLIQLLTSGLLPVVLVVVGPAASASSLDPDMVFAVCGVAWFAAMSGANRFGQDGSACWLLVASGADRRTARRDLLGGDAALAVVLVPLLLVVGVVLAAVTGGYDRLPAALGLAAAVLGTSLGLAGLASVLTPFPVPADQSNAFSNGASGQGFKAIGLVLLEAVLAAALSLPLLPLLLSGSRGWLLLVGPVYGVLVGAAVREAAAARWCRRAPEVLARLSA